MSDLDVSQPTNQPKGKGHLCLEPLKKQVKGSNSEHLSGESVGCFDFTGGRSRSPMRTSAQGGSLPLRGSVLHSGESVLAQFRCMRGGQSETLLNQRHPKDEYSGFRASMAQSPSVRTGDSSGPPSVRPRTSSGPKSPGSFHCTNGAWYTAHFGT